MIRPINHLSIYYLALSNPILFCALRGAGKWCHCPVVRGSTARVKPDQVLVGGAVKVHLEGYYSIEWHEDGSMV